MICNIILFLYSWYFNPHLELTMCKMSSTCFTNRNSFNSLDNPQRWLLTLSACYKWKNWGTKKMSGRTTIWLPETDLRIITPGSFLVATVEHSTNGGQHSITLFCCPCAAPPPGNAFPSPPPPLSSVHVTSPLPGPPLSPTWSFFCLCCLSTLCSYKGGELGKSKGVPKHSGRKISKTFIVGKCT